MKLIAQFLFLIFFCSSPWKSEGCSLVQEQGGFYCSTHYSTYNTSHFWNKNGKKLPSYNDFHKKTYHAYSEYGLTSLDTLGIWGSYSRIEESVNGRTIGFADFEINWRHLWCQYNGHNFATQVIAIVPAESTYKPGLRYGRYGGEISLLYLREFDFYHRGAWCETRLGYRTYDGFPSDQIRADLMVGYQLFSRLEIMAEAFLDFGLFNGDFYVNQNVILYNPNYRLLKLQVEGYLTLTDFAYINVGYFQHVWGENIGTGGGLFAGACLIF